MRSLLRRRWSRKLSTEDDAVAPVGFGHGVRVVILCRSKHSIILGLPRNAANSISAPPRKNLKAPPRPSGFSRGFVYGDMDAVAHDGTVDMGFRGAPVVLDVDGPVILDLLVLRFSLFPAQGGSPPASRTRVENQNGFRPPLLNPSITIVVVNATRARRCIPDRARKAVGLARPSS